MSETALSKILLRVSLVTPRPAKDRTAAQGRLVKPSQAKKHT